MLIIQLALWLGLFLCATSPAYPHGGGLVDYGCHHNRKAVSADPLLHPHAQTRLFDGRYGVGASARLRSMLEGPGFAYQHIANEFGLTRQYIAQVAKRLGINGQRRRRQCERERVLGRDPRVIKVEYPPGILSVIDKIRQVIR